MSDRYTYGQLVEINSHSLFSKWFSEVSTSRPSAAETGSLIESRRYRRRGAPPHPCSRGPGPEGVVPAQIMGWVFSLPRDHGIGGGGRSAFTLSQRVLILEGQRGKK